MGRVAPGGYPPGAPTDPDVQFSRIRFLKPYRIAHGKPNGRPWRWEAYIAQEAG